MKAVVMVVVGEKMRAVVGRKLGVTVKAVKWRVKLELTGLRGVMMKLLVRVVVRVLVVRLVVSGLKLRLVVLRVRPRVVVMRGVGMEMVGVRVGVGTVDFSR